MPKILVVDDDDQLRRFITRSLGRVGFESVSADDGQAAIEALGQQSFDAVVCDLHMTDVDGLDVLKFSGRLDPRPPFIMITAYGSVSAAVEAMKHGAADFLEKPVGIEELRACIQGSINRRTASSGSPAPASEGPGRRSLVGSEYWLGPFFPLLERIAATDTLVLLDGETGTGKSAVAREIWRMSKRASGPFIEVNCAAIPEQLMESELFGHMRGAFTSAESDYPGKVAQADGGTLFLDEVGELPQQLQPKLLHLLSERTYQPIGSSSSRTADVRFIAATNRDLEQDVRDGRFRKDLYYRLNVMNLTIPPLRDRRTDVPVLVEHFRHHVRARVGHVGPHFSKSALDLLSAYDWPGNVRELENVVEQMSIMRETESEVQSSDLPVRFHRAPSPSTGTALGPEVKSPSTDLDVTPPPSLDLPEDVNLKEAVAQYERTLILNVLRQEQGNKTKAAKRLRTKRTTLIEKCNRYNITMDDLTDDEAASDT